MIRIGSDTDIGMNTNSSDWLGMNFNPILLPGSFDEIRLKSIPPNPSYSASVQSIYSSESAGIRTDLSIRINPCSNWTNPKSDSFWLRIWFKSIQAWIYSNWKLGSDLFALMPWLDAEWMGSSRIYFLAFFIKQETKHFSDWFGMTQNGVEWLRTALIRSDWIPIRNFHQGVSTGFLKTSNTLVPTRY